ncbi:MAG TPA: carbohydrate ABC transporter permease, partial [Bacillota bacterium]|nr:carbohydrate ABC transporter permease [Bacillota bacterium]
MIHRVIHLFHQKTARNWSMLKKHRWYHQSQSIVKKAFIYFLLIDGAFIFLLPVLYMLLLSFFTENDLVNTTIRWIPIHLYWQNYRTAFNLLSYPSSLMTTLMLTTVAVFGQTIFCGFAGYALARLDFPGRKWIVGLVIFILVIPNQAMVLPNYIFFFNLGLNRSTWPLILPELLGNGLYSALFIFVFRQVFSGIPKELEDAAAIDGANLFKTFWVIAAPIAQNAYVTVGLFSFVLHWNEFIRPVNYLNINSRPSTLALALTYFSVVDP